MLSAGSKSTLLVFSSLAFAPSEECGRCLLTKLGLAQFTARLFWRFDDDWYRAVNIFDAVPPHTLAGGYTRPIHTPHKALPLNTRVHSKAAGEEETDGFALAPQTMQAAFRTTGIVGAVEPGEQREATRFVPRHAQ